MEMQVGTMSLVEWRMHNQDHSLGAMYASAKRSAVLYRGKYRYIYIPHATTDIQYGRQDDEILKTAVLGPLNLIGILNFSKFNEFILLV